MSSRKSSKKKPSRARKKTAVREISVLEHFLVPKHRVLSPEEAEQVLKKYGTEPQKLPYIHASDPVVKALGAKPGDIIEIIRDSPTAGKAVYYRLVVKSV